MSFENSLEGFIKLMRWTSELMAETEKDSVMVGMEPTGHYWFPFAFWLREQGVKILLVNPLHVKRSKELDDGQPSKHDRKDPKTIAKLVLEGRYSEPYIPEGVYSYLRVTMELRWRVVKELTVIENRNQRWLKIYFSEYGQVFRSFTWAASMAVLKQSPLPCDLAELGIDGIDAIWRKLKLRAVGMKRTKRVYDAAKASIGCKQGIQAARIELRILQEDYDAKHRQYDEIMAQVGALCT